MILSMSGQIGSKFQENWKYEEKPSKFGCILPTIREFLVSTWKIYAYISIVLGMLNVFGYIYLDPH